MDFDDDFEPRLGRQGNTGSKKAGKLATRYASRVAIAAGLIGGAKGGRKFVGSRIGRGAAVAGRSRAETNIPETGPEAL
jgi:hypothetical protein